MTYLDCLDLQAEMALGRLNAAARRKNDIVETMKEILRDAYNAGRESAVEEQDKSDG